MADGAKAGFNWIARSDALPMLGRKVEKAHQFKAVFLQT